MLVFMLISQPTLTHILITRLFHKELYAGLQLFWAMVVVGAAMLALAAASSRNLQFTLRTPQ